MSEPLGRDRLGRLVYEGDYFYGSNLGDKRQVAKAFYWWADLSQYTVDLTASPKRSNWARYFGDIEQPRVIYAAEAICNGNCARNPDECCAECPFCEWAYSFGGRGLCLNAFIDWLDMEATV